MKVVDRDVAHLALDMSDECSMQAGLVREQFLRPALGAPHGDEVERQDLPRTLVRTCRALMSCSHQEQFPQGPLLRHPLLRHNRRHQEAMMFITHDAFRHPLQIEPEATIWQAVEIGWRVPLLMATLREHDEPVDREFLLFQEELLMRLIRKDVGGDLVAVHIVSPPAWSGVDTWTLQPLTKIQRDDGAAITAPPRLYLTGKDHRVYSGFPLEPTTNLPTNLSTCWTSPRS